MCSEQCNHRWRLSLLLANIFPELGIHSWIFHSCIYCFIKNNNHHQPAHWGDSSQFLTPSSVVLTFIKVTAACWKVATLSTAWIAWIGLPDGVQPYYSCKGHLLSESCFLRQTCSTFIKLIFILHLEILGLACSITVTLPTVCLGWYSFTLLFDDLIYFEE